jgi:hypothetical protein
VIVTSIVERAEVGQPFFRFLCSDLHLGSGHADHDLIARQFAKAQAIGARILINGDVFDAIGPKDKRFDLNVLHPKVAGQKDLAKAIVTLGRDLLWPYRESIDLIGIGNHEETWINYGYNDPVQRLIEELNGDHRKSPPIRHASVMGFVRTRFVVDGHKPKPAHRLLYLHGTGGDSPVTKGTIDFNRKGRNWTYDCLTFGHKHNYVCMADQIAEVDDAGFYSERRQLNLQTASYYRNYSQLPNDEPLNYSYAERSAHPPKPQGGVTLIMIPELDANGCPVVTQEFASAIVIPSRKNPSRKRPSKGQE